MKRDLYAEITGRIVDALERGQADGNKWRRPWVEMAATGIPANAATKRPYRGVNVLQLWITAEERGYPANQWATYRQWQSLGAHVRRGEKGTPVVFYRRIEKVRVDEETGEEVRETIPLLRYSTVFNAAQVDGYEAPEPADLPEGADRIDAIETFVTNTGADVRYGGNRAFYSAATDHVQMPHREQFVSTDGYYATLFHELTHWTGHPDRLNRDLRGRFGDRRYAAEELVAELGAAFLCAEFGLAAEPRDDHAHYVASWLDALRADKRAIFTAAARAADAARYLRGEQAKAEADC